MTASKSKPALLDLESLKKNLTCSGLASISESLLIVSEKIIKQRPHGDVDKWLNAIQALPDIEVDDVDFNRPAIKISNKAPITRVDRDLIREKLLALHPWRKGPFEIMGVHIDSEWRSDLKWSRLEKYIQPLKDRIVLDVGCGNGYYMLRMMGQGAKYVLGIDPTQLFIAQFKVIQKYIADLPGVILPLRCEELPFDLMLTEEVKFDTVFSMGVLYHRKKPTDHLLELKRYLRVGGELVLETLIINSDEDTELVPAKSYAKMPNVRTIPTPCRLIRLLGEAGFTGIRVIDISKTTIHEQRRTEWMIFESLTDYLDKDDPHKTIEGYPAPQRICITAYAKT